MKGVHGQTMRSARVAVMLGQLQLMPLSQSPREACSRLAGQKTHRLLQKTKVHYRAHKSPPPPVPYSDPRRLSVRFILILHFHLSLGLPILRKANTIETGARN